MDTVPPTPPDDLSPGDLPAPSHLETRDGITRARMVDVGKKQASARSALARARVVFPAGVRERVLAGRGPKGAVEEVARVAGILAAKRTAELIPLCHPLGLDVVDVEFRLHGDTGLDVLCRASNHGPTGVEMEALTGAAVAALTVYDMAKGVDKGIVVQEVVLLEKTGGKSGTWRRAGD